MHFPKEPYVRIYTTVSPTARLWRFFGRVLMEQLVKAADRAGIIDIPDELRGDLSAAVASIIDCPDIDWVREWLPLIMEHGAIEVREDMAKEHVYLVLTRYNEAQYSPIDKNHSNMMSERKKRDTERAIKLGLIEASPVVVVKKGEEGAA